MTSIAFAPGDIVYTWKYAQAYGVRKLIVTKYDKRGCYIYCKILDSTAKIDTKNNIGQEIILGPSGIHRKFSIAQNRARRLITAQKRKTKDYIRSAQACMERYEHAFSTLDDMIL